MAILDEIYDLYRRASSETPNDLSFEFLVPYNRRGELLNLPSLNTAFMPLPDNNGKYKVFGCKLDFADVKSIKICLDYDK